MIRTLALILSLFMVSPASKDVFGVWQTIDDATGKIKSHVEIYKGADNKVYGKIVKIIDPEKQANKCTKCTGDKKNQPLLGLIILEGLIKDGDEYEDGTIVDPEQGKTYNCSIWVDDTGVLQVRGYWGFFFRTQSWVRLD